MSERVSAPRSAIAPFIVMDVMEAAAEVEAQGHSVLHLEVGQPSTPAPRTAIVAAQRALESDKLGYSVARGLPLLRARIAQHYQDYYGVSVSEDAAIATTGASGAFVLAFLAAFEPGARVAIARPGYPCYRNILQALGLVPVEIDVDASTDFQLTPEHLAYHAPDGVILASPANPTGSVLTPSALEALIRRCEARGIVAVVDEIYHGLSYGGARSETAARFTDRAFVINSFSKYFSMTGWRLGWMLTPTPYRSAVEALAQNLVICPPTLSQIAGAAAFDAYAELDQHVARYAENRRILLDALQGAGITSFAPAEGAFYVYADVSRFTSDSRAFCRRMLDEIHVATTPGIDFDPVRGHHWMRFSYCTSTDAVREAGERLGAWLR
jgi:aspartate/methionine/tyrosine aminotransferase